MKVNKKYLLLRILTFPLKLTFMLGWYIVFGMMITVRWVITGSQEILVDSGKISQLVEQNEKIIEQLTHKPIKKNKNENTKKNLQ